MEIVEPDYTVKFNEQEKYLKFEGSIRLKSLIVSEPLENFLEAAANTCEKGTLLTIDLSEMVFMNSAAITILSVFVVNSRKKDLFKILIKGAYRIPWQEKTLLNWRRLWEEIVLELN